MTEASGTKFTCPGRDNEPGCTRMGDDYEHLGATSGLCVSLDEIGYRLWLIRDDIVNAVRD
jgi:hypothetical protein